MPRPITLFTGQWADLPFEEVAKLASQWGYDGPVCIESFTGDNATIATAASIWRPLAPSQDRLATDGLAFLKGFCS